MGHPTRCASLGSETSFTELPTSARGLFARGPLGSGGRFGGGPAGGMGRFATGCLATALATGGLAAAFAGRLATALATVLALRIDSAADSSPAFHEKKS